MSFEYYHLKELSLQYSYYVLSTFIVVRFGPKSQHFRLANVCYSCSSSEVVLSKKRKIENISLSPTYKPKVH